MERSDAIRLDWSIPHPWQFLGAILLAALAARILHSALRAIKLNFDAGGSRGDYGLVFLRCLGGFHRTREGTARATDYGYNFILGMIELGCYPILITIGAWTPIGAWVGLKALAQYGVWANERSVFNLFLIGSAVNVLISLLLLTRFVAVP